MSLIRSSYRYGCGEWRLMLVLVLFVVLSLLHNNEVQAVITILENHETFANTMDGNYGRSFNSGYEYYARLQQVGSLCGSSSSSSRNVSVVEPADQLPVALLLSNHEYNENATGTDDDHSDSDSDSSSNGCTLQTQIDNVLNHVFPLGRVKYLIVATAEEEEEQPPEETSQRHHWWWPRKTMRHSPFPQHFILQEDKFPPLHVLPVHRTDEPLYILHVSTATYDTLYRHLERQTDNTILEGGIQISMNDNRHSHRHYNGGGNSNEDQNEMILTTALIAFVTAGVCFLCLILCGAGDWDDDDDHNHGGAATQPPRPVRQRLTREQVRERFPVYRYDGQSKLVRCGIHCNPSSSSPPTDTTTTTTPLDSLQQPLLPVQSSSSSSSSSTTHGTVESSSLLQNEVIENIVLDVCSICLDEYERLDKVRILPCHHTFHSKCVGRWLSERSAVCPLCKENYYIEEEDEEEEAAVDTATTATMNTTTPVSSGPLWRRVWEHYAAVPPTTVAAVNTTTTNVDLEMPMETVVPEAPNHRAVATDTTGRISTSWWSRMFPQVTLSPSSSPLLLLLRNQPDSLTEPLLQPPLSQDDHVEATVPPAVESSVTDITNSGNSPDTTVAPLRHTTTPIDTTGVSSSPLSHAVVMTTVDEVVQVDNTTVEPCDTTGVAEDDRGADTTPVVPDP